MALTPPFVLPQNQKTPNVGSTPTLIFGSEQTCFIDNISFCNTCGTDLYFWIYVLDEILVDDVPTPRQTFRKFHQLLKADETLDMVFQTIDIPASGDLYYAYSDFSGNFFDSIVYYRALTEVPA